MAIGSLIVAAVAVPITATPASAYTASGTIAHPTPIGNGTTDLNFAVTCPAPPHSQGVNGWVFTLPTGTLAGTGVSVTGADALNLHDVEAYVYKTNCTYSRLENSAGKDLYFLTQAGDGFVSVFTANGSNVTVTLTIPASPPSASGPNDPLYAQNGADDLFYAGQWNMRKVHAVDAWNTGNTGAGITVADLDTGLDLGHPDFNCPGKVTIVANPDPAGGTSSPDDDNGHGTHTAGIIGACTNNNIGVVGVAPDSTIMPIKVLTASGNGGAPALATAIHTATDEGAHVINMSLGFSASGAPYSGSALGFLGGLPEIDEAVDYAVSHGVVVVAAAGNESAGLCGYPALAYNVICVGSSDPHDLNSWYGNFPVKDDDEDLLGPGLLAPGGTGGLFCDMSSLEIISTYDRAVDTAEGDCDTLPGYASIQGTSMATPLVAGIAALVYDQLGGTRSTTNAARVTQAIISSAVDLYTPGYDPMSGYGRVDALAAVNYAAATW